MKRLMIVLGSLLCLWSAVGAAEESAGPDQMPLAAAVLQLEMGEGGFLIGAPLTADQLQQARDGLLDDAYPGTIKFASGAVFVVADEKTNMVLAVFQRREEVRVDDVKQMVGQLMARYGEPTTMAHDTLIYWAYGSGGRIDEDAYSDAKTAGKIDILATVKFSSSLKLSPGMSNENSEETGTIYYIITSDQLLERFVSNP